MSSPHAHAPTSGDPFPRLLELARLWSARPRWDELQFALGLAEGDAARLGKEREDLHDFVAREHPPDVIRLQRGILEHEEQMSAGSSRQLLRSLNELCELHNLTQAHTPHLLGHVPDVHQFTGRTDRPPPSDAPCEAYAGQVRALLGQLLAEEQRRRAGTAVVTRAGVEALRGALADLLTACEADPVRRTLVQAGDGAVRAVFGGVRDNAALAELVRRSSALSAPARDTLAGVVDRLARLSGGVVWDDTDGITEAEHRERVKNHTPDEAPVRDLRQAIRAALDALPTSDPGAAAPANTSGAGSAAATAATNTKKGRGKHIEAQMLKMISEDAARCDWTARVWADRLGCSEGTVKGTAAWKRAMQARKLRDADRVARTGERKDRRRNGRT